MNKETYSKPIVEIEKFKRFEVTTDMSWIEGGDLDYTEEENPFA